jgi:hypothetical protein
VTAQYRKPFVATGISAIGKMYVAAAGVAVSLITRVFIELSSLQQGLNAVATRSFATHLGLGGGANPGNRKETKDESILETSRAGCDVPGRRNCWR